MPSQPASGNCPPRIYCIAASTIAHDDDWPQLLTHIHRLGFDTLLLTDSATLALPSTQTSPIDTLQRLTEACRDQGLQLFIDLELDRFPTDHPLVVEQAHHFYQEDAVTDTLPDPRFQSGWCDTGHARLRLDSEGLELARQYWQTQLTQWLQADLAGFRCLSLARIAPWLWRDLIHAAKASAPSACFIAWTPGTPGDQLLALRDCGFDFTVASDAWWDYRADWLIEEQHRLSAVAPVLAAPEDPAGPRLQHRLHLDDARHAEHAYRRALLIAGATAHGMLLNAGFEYGNGTALGELYRDEQWRQPVVFDLSADIKAINQQFATSRDPMRHVQQISAPHADLILLQRTSQAEKVATLTVINADLFHPHTLSSLQLHENLAGWTVPDDGQLTLSPAEVRTIPLQTLAPVAQTPSGGKNAVIRATRNARVAIEQISPVVDHGRFAAKRIAGSVIEVEADIFGDGHDKLAASVLWRPADDKQWQRVPMRLIDNDRWRAVLPLQRIGRHFFMVEAWRDNFATFRDELEKKHNAGLNVSLELLEGRLLVEKTLAEQAEDSDQVAALKKLLKQLPAKSKKKLDEQERAQAVELFLNTDTATLMAAADLRDFSTCSEEFRIDVERRAAEFSSWYELFPRSQSGDIHRHGTFDDVIARIPAVRDMGFDTLYFPPIHPIGSKNKKGKNNTLTPAPDDPGSPYAIGSPDGGHDAVHPELGTLDDFRRMLRVARAHGLEIALDFAIQCSPDHPWLQDHPEWFAWRPDGSIRYAENPPKKYEDIVNVDFYATSGDHPAIPELWIALRDVVLMWVREEVRVFRVDNPHTKPLPFWEWMIGDIRSRYPDVIFLSEAFTRPKPMYRLAKVGFSQSYTYFTWRHTKQEFIDYLSELTATSPAGGPRDFFRPHFFVNTPDINPYFLQRSGRAGFVIRAALAATLSGLWGVYSGFELCEAQAVTGKEEYLDSEKYEIRAWDWQRPGNIVREVTQLNRIRTSNPALHTHLNVRFHTASDDHILYFSKSTRGTSADRFGDNTLLIAINLDPFAAHESTIDLPLWQFGLHDDAEVEVEELMSESRFTWRGRQQHVRLDPQQLPFAIWRLRPSG
ncbi:alpha-1,4-glucan--maltose-1-phosphate maltosyltransferase [Oxalicibacterium faecigallinarum]|uniref:Alpha-1,4-glucan:maltose-1-phosphate maltosyltransferase n=1 Tax=Oxalicibacterium faecigallinarum TaxID=573741 RepID=A0A8J3AUB8_9BURK|nr:alpha-1,4-glucan--maltose-1-phosphate maltosyltransferase [Oxalicibacterium faecigallinarum]GGI20974.1 alpha-1,4-glucan:maltose-1-phosphate maltosyltransferase [Oxalicibacterium faecigallinarum]